MYPVKLLTHFFRYKCLAKLQVSLGKVHRIFNDQMIKGWFYNQYFALKCHHWNIWNLKIANNIILVNCFHFQDDGHLYESSLGTVKKNVALLVEPLSGSPPKWSNTLKQLVGCCRKLAWVCLTILWGWRLNRKVIKCFHCNL